MSKRQSQINEIVKQAAKDGETRKDTIAAIASMYGISEAYAATLYATARKQLGLTKQKTPRAQRPKPSSLDFTEGFNKPNLNGLRAELEQAFKDIAERHGVTVKLGGIRYWADTASGKLEFIAGTGQDADKAKFLANCWRAGLQETDFGRTFNYKGETWTVCGANARAKRYPIVARNASGRRVRFTRNVLGL